MKAGIAMWMAVTLALGFGSGCGGDDDDSAGGSGGSEAGAPNGASDSGSGSTTLSGETETGMALTAELFVDARDPDLADIETFRELVGADPVVYTRVVADNSDGGVEDGGRFLVFTGDEGDTFGADAIESRFVCSAIYDWLPDDDPSNDAIFEAYNELYDACGTNMLAVPVPAGETVTYYVVTDGEPEFTRVFAGVGNELT